MESARHLLRVVWASVMAGSLVCFFVFGSSASGTATAFDCRPQPALGSLALVRAGRLQVIDLASCRERLLRTGVRGHVEFGAGGRVRIVPASSGLLSPDRRFLATVRVTGTETTLRNTIWVSDRRSGESHAVFSARVWGSTTCLTSPGPIILLGWSEDARWLFFAIDPGGSGSIAADGLILRVVSARGGAPHKLVVMLAFGDYLSGCGRGLVFTAGADRIATDNKRLLVAMPPDWRPLPLVRTPRRAWGTISCAPDGRSIAVQSQPQSTDSNFFHTRWALWRVSLGGSQRRLTYPPRGYADESPRFSRDGRAVLFVRSRKGVGKLYALRDGKLIGPLLSLGYSLGYYGHQNWWQSMDWSLESWHASK